MAVVFEAQTRLEIDVQAPGEKQPTRHALHVWTQKGGDCVGRLDADATFRLERAACDALRLDLLKKTAD